MLPPDAATGVRGQRGRRCPGRGRRRTRRRWQRRRAQSRQRRELNRAGWVGGVLHRAGRRRRRRRPTAAVHPETLLCQRVRKTVVEIKFVQLLSLYKL